MPNLVEIRSKAVRPELVELFIDEYRDISKTTLPLKYESTYVPMVCDLWYPFSFIIPEDEIEPLLIQIALNQKMFFRINATQKVATPIKEAW